MPAARTGPDASTTARDAQRLSTLLEVSQALSGTLNLKSSLQRLLQTLIRHHSVVRGMITLLRDGELHVEAVEGFEDRARNVVEPDAGRRPETVAVVDRGRVEVPAAVLERDLRTPELDQPGGVAVGGGRIVRECYEGAAHREAARARKREVELPGVDVLAALAARRNGGGEQTEEGVPDGSCTPQGQRPSSRTGFLERRR